MARSAPESQPAADVVVTKAVVRAATALGVQQRELAAILGVSAASVSRLQGGRTIDPKSKEGELALLFLRVFRSLDALVGGHGEKAHAWFSAYNSHLQGVPAELVRGVEGLARVAEYLDAMRGKL